MSLYGIWKISLWIKVYVCYTSQCSHTTKVWINKSLNLTSVSLSGAFCLYICHINTIEKYLNLKLNEGSALVPLRWVCRVINVILELKQHKGVSPIFNE